MPGDTDHPSLLDLGKLECALVVMTRGFQRGPQVRFASADRDLEYLLVDFGCLGSWPHTRPLERGVLALGKARGETPEESFARLDRVLDEVIAQAPHEEGADR